MMGVGDAGSRNGTLTRFQRSISNGLYNSCSALPDECSGSVSRMCYAEQNVLFAVIDRVIN